MGESCAAGTTPFFLELYNLMMPVLRAAHDGF